MLKLQQRIEEHALKNRRIYLWDEITDTTAVYILERMEYLRSKSKDPITMLIHSPGGCVAAEGAIIDEMVACQQEGIIVSPYVINMAHSAAACILAMGTPGHRILRPRSTVMFHPGRYGMRTDYTSQQEKLAKFIKKVENHDNEEVAKACGKTPASFEKSIKDGLWMMADDAVKYGAADRIESGPIPFFCPPIGAKKREIERGPRSKRR